jgi:hypothetical protein
VSPADRNMVEFYADGGVNIAGASDRRPNDKIGFAFAYTRISSQARDLDCDFGVFTHSDWPVRDFEAVLSLNYLAETHDRLDGTSRAAVHHPSLRRRDCTHGCSPAGAGPECDGLRSAFGREVLVAYAGRADARREAGGWGRG